MSKRASKAKPCCKLNAIKFLLLLFVFCVIKIEKQRREEKKKHTRHDTLCDRVRIKSVAEWRRKKNIHLNTGIHYKMNEICRPI